jgi:3-phosphoshikimate 1-carboxyvinyltransferase
MALDFAPALMRTQGLSINHPQVVTKSYPQFWQDIEACGFEVKSEE